MQFNTSFNIHDISVIGFTAGDKQCSLGRFGRAQLIAGNRDIQVGAGGTGPAGGWGAGHTASELLPVKQGGEGNTEG